MKRRQFLQEGALAGGALALSGKNLFAGESRPNVLMILVDQWRQRRWFPEHAKLPGYERLCREGLEFTNFFTSAVPCSPSRACLFTGLHITQHGIQSNVNFGMEQDLDPKIPNLAQGFHQAGYRTPYFGKWHLTGMKETVSAKLDAYGFTDWVPPDHHGTPYDGTLHDRMFANEAIGWLLRNGRKGPFYLTCSMVNPHDICYYPRLDIPPALVPDMFENLPDNFEDNLKTKPRIQTLYQYGYGKLMGCRRDLPKAGWLHYLDFYYHLTRMVDRQISRLLAVLDRLGLSDNTIVVFTSDHGDMCGSHRLQAKGPFIYQENNNIPLVIRWPGKIRAGSKTAALGQNPDVMPTLFDLAGIRAGTSYLAGKSLVPAINNPEHTSVHDHVLMAMGMNLQSASRGAQSLIAKLGPRLGIKVQGVPASLRAIHDGRYKFARYFDEGCESEFELYDLKNDPLELRNLAHDPGYAPLRKDLADRLQEAEQKEMAPIPREILK